jgi:hypothetical protein
MTISRLRPLLFALAGLTALLSTWQVLVALARPHLPVHGDLPTAIDRLHTERNAIRRAAYIGIVRGDLWSALAAAEAKPLLLQHTVPMGNEAAARLDLVRSSAERAVRLAPHDAHAWLILAATEAHLSRREEQMTAYLKMSFYTGPSSRDLMPLRLALSTRIESAPDEEMQSLIRHELRAMLRQKSDMRPTIAGAYRNASPQGRRFLDLTMGEISPDLATWVRTQVQRP